MTDTGTPDHGTLRPAEWRRRFAAYVIDTVVFVVTGFSLLVLATLAAAGEGSPEFDAERGAAAVGLAAFWLAWEVLWIASALGGKPGQRLAGFRVRTLGGGQVGLRQAFGRAMVKLVGVPAIGLTFLVSAVTIAVTERRQGLHDLLAGTVCLRTESRAAKRGEMPTAPVESTPTSTSTPAASESERHRGPFL